MKGITRFQGGNRELWKEHLAQLANDCHSPEDGRFCSTELGSVGNNVSLVDLEDFHKERIPGLKRMVDEISKVHVMPDLYPKVSVEVWSSVARGAAGAYDPGSKMIRLAEDDGFNASTFVHEFGHHLTLAENGDSKSEFASRVIRDPELKEWLGAVKATPQFLKLHDTMRGGDGSVQITQGQRDHATYLADTRELFARSYAQWIQERSGSGVLKFQHDAIQKRTGGIYQWSDEEFKPIGLALDAWFTKKGLLR